MGADEQARVRKGGEERDGGREAERDQRRAGGAQPEEPVGGGLVPADQGLPDRHRRARVLGRRGGRSGAGRHGFGRHARFPVRHPGRNQRVVHLLDHRSVGLARLGHEQTPRDRERGRRSLSHETGRKRGAAPRQGRPAAPPGRPGAGSAGRDRPGASDPPPLTTSDAPARAAGCRPRPFSSPSSTGPS
jgi:hypothetical protein